MVVASVLYAIDGQLGGFAVILFSAFLLSYIVPLVFNFNRLKIFDFVKGSIYAIFLAPTYVNILTIFAISNIHDVSWGSRPSGGDGAKLAIAARTERIKGIIYRNFRSNFLIIWLLINIAIGYVIVYLSRHDREYIILILGAILAFIILVKLFFSVLFMFQSTCENLLIDRHKSGFFKDVKEKRKSFKNVDYRFNVFFRKNFPHQAIILRPGLLPKGKYYVSSLKEEDIEFGVNLKRINKLRDTYWSGLGSVIKAGRWSKLRNVFKRPTGNIQDSSDSDNDSYNK